MQRSVMNCHRGEPAGGRRTRMIFGLAALLVGGAALQLRLDATPSPQARAEPAPTVQPSPAPAPAPQEATTTPPRPDDALKVRVRLDQGVILPGARQALAMIEVEAAEAEVQGRAPAAVAVVIDASASMGGNKIANARRSATMLLDRLTDEDLLTVVSFSREARTFVRARRLGRDRTGARRLIRRVEADGMTCISCGLELAYRELAIAPEGYRRRVVLISDGVATAGALRPAELRAQAARALRRQRITTVGIGIGRGYDEQTISAIAEGGAGSFYFVHNSKVIPRVLDRELAALRRTAVEGVTLTLTPAAGARLGQLHAAGARRSGEGVVVTVGDLSAGQRRRVLAPLSLDATVSGEVLAVRVDYRLPRAAGRPRALTVRGAVTRTTDQASALASRDPDLQEEWLRSGTAWVVDAAMEAYAAGRGREAVRRLEDQLRQLEQARAAGSRVATAKIPDVQQVIRTCRRYAPTSNVGIATARVNRAKSYEVRRGVPARDLYHVDPFDASELE